MSAAYEVYQHAHRGLRAAPRGFNWKAFLLAGIWTVAHGLWLPAIFLLALDAVFLWLAPTVFDSLPVLFSTAIILPRILVGFQANAWLTRNWQRLGFLYLGLAESASAAGAVRNVGVSPAALLTKYSAATHRLSDQLPHSLRSVLTIARLTVKAALRFRVIQFLAILLVTLVIAFPLILRHDGTAFGLTQIILTYSMGSIVTILCFATFWLAVGNLAREVEDGQMQVLATKPVAFWKIFFGKWLGIMSINLALLVLSGICVQFLIQWRAQQLAEPERAILKRQILTARAPLTAPLPDFVKLAEEQLARNNSENTSADYNRDVVLGKIHENLIAQHQGVMARQEKIWIFPAGQAGDVFRSESTTVRIRFRAASRRHDPVTLRTGWILGDPEATNQFRFEAQLTTDTFHELPVPPGLLDSQGNLPVRFVNLTGEAVVFDINDDPELLYREASFEINVLRAFGILACWLGLAAAVGLTAASKLNFNVASFFTMSLLVIGMFGGTITAVSENRTVWTFHDGGEITTLHRAADFVLVPLIRLLDLLLGSIADYSPIESLSLGRSVTWLELASAFTQCWLIFGTLLAALAIFAFSRREVANPWQS